MTTDQLIELLTADLKPVDRGRISRALIMALAIGAAAAFGAMFLFLKPRQEMFDSRNLNYLLAKLLFTLGVVASAAMFLPRFARPGAEGRSFLAFISLPFVAIMALAAVALASSHWSTWGGMIVGKEWLTCVFSIPLFAIVPFAAVVWALRIGAPTDRTRAGATAGLVAGGLSAAACALPCADDSFLTIALWYGLTIGICTSFGARLGPRLLRW
jgi:hypothetical protein